MFMNRPRGGRSTMTLFCTLMPEAASYKECAPQDLRFAVIGFGKMGILHSGILNLARAKYEGKAYAVASASTKPHGMRENFQKLSHAFLSRRSEQTPLHAELLSSS
jgi:hypothetical protein